ncbi:MAG: Crp/Fnr family transcriptional regulator [Chlorobiota bacterium]
MRSSLRQQSSHPRNSDSNGQHGPIEGLGTEILRLICRTDTQRTKSFPPSATIVRHGEPVAELYYINRGTAKEILLRSKGTRRSELLVSLLKPGDIIGLRDLFGAGHHTVTVIAIEEVQAYPLPIEAVQRSVQQHPQLWMQVAQALAHQIELVEEQLLLAQRRRSAPDRILRLLILLLRIYGIDEQGFLLFPATPYTIAELLQLSPSTVQRVLNSLTRQQLLELRAGKIRVPDSSSLQRLLHPNPRPP